MKTSTIRALIFALLAGCAASPELADEDIAQTQAALTAPSGFTMVAWEDVNKPGLPAIPKASLADLKASIANLQGRNVGIVMEWRAANLDDAARFQVLAEAKTRGVPVLPWLTLPEGVVNEPDPVKYKKTGYFPNDTNYAEWITQAKSLMSLWTSRGYAPTTIFVDFEMRKERLVQFADISKTGDLVQIINFLKANINRTRHQQAIVAFRDFVNYAHARGWKVTATTLLPILDDFSDSDDDIRQGFNVPLEQNPTSSGATAWDTVEFQVQRTLYMESYPLLTEYFVQDYALLSRILYGNKAGVSLGLTQRGISTTAPEYTNATQLRKDVEAALFAGIPGDKLSVYSWLGMYYKPSVLPVSQWFAPPQPLFAIFPDPQTGAVHASFFAIDGLLNGAP